MRYFKNKTILITGATGFVGSNILRRLIGYGCRKTHIIIRKTSDTWRIKDIEKKAHRHYADIRDSAHLKNVVRKIKPRMIFHCAIYGGYSFQKEEDAILDTNINGTINIIRGLSNIAYESFINIGSSSEYGMKNRAMNEDDELCPLDTYGVSKATATVYAQTVAASEKKPITTIRPFSVFGPYEEKTRLIPSLIDACLHDKEIFIRSPLSVRDYIYIDDVVDFFLTVAGKKTSLGILNLAGGRQRSVRDVVRTVERVAKKKLRVKYAEFAIPKLEPRYWIADMKKAKKVLGWRLTTKFESGIRKTIKWSKTQG